MKYFWTCLRIAFSQRLRKVKYWLILLLPLLLIGIRAALPQEQVSAPVQVGVVLPEYGGEEFWQLLSQRSGTVLTFIETDEDTANRNIATGKWDCGLILHEDFDEKIQQGDTKRLFVLRVGEGSSVYPLVQETVASCVANLARVPIAQKYLLTSGIVDDATELDRLYEQLDPQERVNITLSTPTGKALQPFQLADQGITGLLSWLVYISITIWLLLCIYDLGRWSSTYAAKRILPVRNAAVTLLAKLSADGILAAISGVLSMLVIGGGLYGCLAVLSCVLLWTGVGILAAHFPALWQSIPVLPAFIVVSSIIFSGVLVDLSLFAPRWAGICQWFPGRLFLMLCQGKLYPLLPVLGVGLFALVLTFLKDTTKKRCA